MKVYKIGILGYFASGKSKAGGQEAKTCALDKLLKERYGEDQILNIDTTNWKKNPLNFFWKLIKMVIFCKNIIILPAQNGIKIVAPILVILNIFFKRKIYYSVVGGWLAEFLKNNKYTIYYLKKFNKIWVETPSMKYKLEKLKLNNIEIIPNFKYLSNTNIKSFDKKFIAPPFLLCTFSRVLKEKGIEDAIEAVKYINKTHKKIIFKLDIYGKIDEKYKIKFKELVKEFPEYISYKGSVEPEDSVKIIKDYYALLFPTHYYTEGIPGTIIDAYAAGVPVICSLWGNHKDIFFDGFTGMGYEFKNLEALKKILEEILKNPYKLINMKKKCLLESKKYRPEYVLKKIEKYF